MKFLSVLLSFIIFFSPLAAFAGAAEKWEVLENYYDSSTQKVHIEARKIAQQASNSSRYKVDVPVTPSALGKTLKTMMWTGVAVASVEALLEGIGWVIDEGSQIIKREKPNTDDPLQPPDGYFEFSATNYIGGTVTSGTLSGLVAALQADMRANWRSDIRIELVNITWTKQPKDVAPGSSTSVKTLNYYLENNSKTTPWQTGVVTAKNIVRWDPDAVEPEYEYLSDEALGNEVLGQGENTTPLPDAITQAYNPENPVGTSEPAPKASDDALSSANPEPETEPTGEAETKTETNPETGEETDKTTFTWPNACEWFPAACDFFSVQKQDNKEIKENQEKQLEQDKTFFEKVSDFIDFIMGNYSEPEIDKPEVPTTDLEQQEIKDDLIRINARSCPADIQFDVQGLPFGIQVNRGYQMQPICNTLEPLKYVFHLITVCICAFMLLRI